MAAKPPQTVFEDSLFELSKGMDSGVLPLLLDKDKLSFGLNMTVRNGFATNRPGFHIVPIDFKGDTNAQTGFTKGQWQGGTYYKPDFDPETLVVQIGGRLFQITPNDNFTATAREVSVPNDPNASTAQQAWLWQAENYVIANDGLNVPIFFDGVSSRRSLGNVPANLIIGVIAAAPPFVAPAQGANVTVILNAPPTITLNLVVEIGGKRYGYAPGNDPNQVIATNVSAPVKTYLAGTQVQIVPSNVGVNTHQFTSIIVPAGNFLFPGLPTETVGVILDSKLPAVGTSVTIGGIKWFVLVTAAAGGNGQLTRLWAGGPTHTIHVGDIMSLTNNHTPSTLVGTLTINFTSPAVGSTALMELSGAYTGATGQDVWINGTDHYQLAPSPSVNPNAVTLTNIDDTPATVLNGQTITAIAELPPGRMGTYGMGRVWESLVDGISFIAGDIVGGPSGTPSLKGRDAVLKVTENTFLAGGGAFRVPGSVGDIRSMNFTANMDASLGQGPLQVGTPNGIFSCNAPVNRVTTAFAPGWQDVTNPILTESLLGFGPLGQNNTISVNSDTIFRSSVGLGSLILARREFYSWGNTPISNEMTRVFDRDAVSLCQFGSSVNFQNRLLTTAQPTNNGNGVYHRGLVALDYEPISNIQTKLPPVYDGLWTGINILQVITGQFNGNNRSFALTFNIATQSIELYEISRDGLENFDNDTIPITWFFETASLFKNLKNKSMFDLVRLVDGEIYVEGIRGRVNFQVFYKPDQYPCWIPWHSWSVCQSVTGAANPQPSYRTRMGLGEPSSTDCEPVNNRPFREGYTFQFKFVISGTCRFIGAKFKTVKIPQPEYAPQVCKELCLDNSVDSTCQPCGVIDCLNPDDFDVYSLQNNLNPVPPFSPFTSNQVTFVHACPIGQTLTFTGVLPGWITLDAANSQLVGIAGTFTGSSTADATQKAQTALDDFANTALASGALFCASGICCPTDNYTTFGAGITSAFPAITVTGDPAVPRMVFQDKLVGVIFIDTSNDTQIANPTTDQNDRGCFVSSTQEFAIPDNFNSGISAGKVLFFDKDGNPVASPSTGAIMVNQGPVVYNSVADKVIGIYLGLAAHTHIFQMDPHTHTLDFDTDVGATYQPEPLWYVPATNRIVVFSSDTLYFLDPVGLAVTGTMLGSVGDPSFFALGFSYAPNTQKMFIGTYKNGATGEVVEADPTTLTVLHEYPLPDPTANAFSIEYNANNGTIVVLTDKLVGLVIDPVTHSTICTFTIPNIPFAFDRGQLGCDALTGHVYVGDSNLLNVQAFKCP